MTEVLGGVGEVIPVTVTPKSSTTDLELSRDYGVPLVSNETFRLEFSEGGVTRRIDYISI